MSIDYVKIMPLFTCAIIACMAATKTNMNVNNRKSQRTACFNGGIKTGTTAFDKESKTLDMMPLTGLNITCSVSQALIEKSCVPVYVIPVRYVDNAYDWKRARLFADYDYMNTVEA